METRDSDLFFLATASSDPLRGLVRIKTPIGMPHVAFESRELGELYIALRNMKSACALIATADIQPTMSFDFDRQGVLVLGSAEVVENFAVDVAAFDCTRHLQRINIPVRSIKPW